MACGPKFTDSQFRLKDFKGQCADKWAASVEQTGALRYQDHSSRKLLLPQRLEGRERGGGVSRENGALGGTRAGSGQGKTTHFFLPRLLRSAVLLLCLIQSMARGKGPGRKPCRDCISEHRVRIKQSKGGGGIDAWVRGGKRGISSPGDASLATNFLDPSPLGRENKFGWLHPLTLTLF